MSGPADPPRARLAGPGDAEPIALLLDGFNREFGEPTPGPRSLARRVSALLAAGELTVLLAGEGPDGLAVLRFRPAIWSEALECYLAELYVVPARRRRGLGRALMTASLEAARVRGADRIELGTSEGDVAARALYESLGFSNLEGESPGSAMLFYEREL
ncbi:MAG TPA: GNAT family N-acetyltransferase [Solirubrobacteraceae bacterium]|nr:GNAT family N-acetyltransferase [Solirubrobacteraceae bacterium]